MKSIIRNRTASGVLIASLAIASSAFSVQAFAQDASSPHATRSAARSANHKLERAVRKALDSAKVEASDIRIVARGGKVTLDGTVMTGERTNGGHLIVGTQIATVNRAGMEFDVSDIEPSWVK